MTEGRSWTEELELVRLAHLERVRHIHQLRIDDSRRRGVRCRCSMWVWALP